VFATSVPLSDNTACAAFTSTPEHAHQKPNITVADVSEISASEHEIGVFQLLFFFFNFSNVFILAVRK
jgi:hypothetical protein